MLSAEHNKLKMHLIVGIRGIKHDFDRFISDLSGKYLPYKFYNPETKQLQEGHVQVSVRPIQLFEIVFPEESKDIILTTIFPNHTKGGHYGNAATERYKWILNKIRKLIGIEEMPEDFDKSQTIPLWNKNIEVVGIGIKKDVRNEYGVEML